MNADQKISRYQRIAVQLSELFRKTHDPVARMSTMAAILQHKFTNFFWTGFYRLIDGELTVGPYQGSVACLVLAKQTGVCWAAIDKKQSMVVPDVHDFPGRIACDSRSQSELVIPVYDESGEIVAVLDIDSKTKNSFDEVDAAELEKIVKLIYNK
ncbi:MAG: GAF domain-containing protein [Candidatus Cloacimonetes bacterium]|nr:GAF domain-containing protein [Candidatus Cloacimonadota bacterium]